MSTAGKLTTRRAAFDEMLLAFAAEVGDTDPVAVEGGRTRWDAGGPPVPGTRLVRAPAGIVEYRPEEMTVRVRAGTAVEELHEALGARGQRTALPRRGGTVGGALAVGEDDVCVLGRGRVRDAVLQIRYVSADGAVVTGGGPTVKNVTGYDLPRLLVGSLGTLGLLGEAIIRTNPVPAVSRWFSAEGADPFAAREALFRPSAVLFDGRTTWVQLEGHAADVEAERRGLAGDPAVGGDWQECERGPVLPPHRWSLRPSELRCVDGSQLGEFVASVGVGTVFASLPAPARPQAAALGALAGRIKHEFDPTGRLNPGRSPR
ncbi:MAG: FAD-binding protein [Actinomycetota bacterium]|nr:FAD-binding protein [Actinomycetota bacterium]